MLFAHETHDFLARWRVALASVTVSKPARQYKCYDAPTGLCIGSQVLNDKLTHNLVEALDRERDLPPLKSGDLVSPVYDDFEVIEFSGLRVDGGPIREPAPRIVNDRPVPDVRRFPFRGERLVYLDSPSILCFSNSSSRRLLYVALPASN